MANPIFVAVDTPDIAAARALVRAVGRHVGGVKLGLEFFCANGPAGVAAIAGEGLPVFLDLKLHDIPNTVAGALHSLAGLAPAIVTVHATGGLAMLAAARAALSDREVVELQLVVAIYSGLAAVMAGLDLELDERSGASELTRDERGPRLGG